MSEIRVALVHDWLTGMRGGESVLEALIELFPQAELFTLLHIPGKVSRSIESLKIHTSWLQRVPMAERRYRHFLPLMPRMIESFDFRGFDLIVSSSHCVAKGLLKPEQAVHVSYVHTPMRYVWDRFDEYFGPGRAGPLVRIGARVLRARLQRWDRESSARGKPGSIDHIVANSAYIASRIRETWGREASVVHPFADLSRFRTPRKPGRNYLIVAAFAPYKRLDIAVEAFNRLKLPLLIVGGGQDETHLRAMAGPSVEFLGALSAEAIADLFSKCRAFIFPGIEDFGITPLEAMAAGAPVIAYDEGGATETVDSQTGLRFRPHTVEALMDAVMRVERGEARFQAEDCRARAADFTREAFQRGLSREIVSAWTARGRSPLELKPYLERWL